MTNPDLPPGSERARRRRARRATPAADAEMPSTRIEELHLPALDVPGARLTLFERLTGERLPERLLALALTWICLRDTAPRLAASLCAASGAVPDEATWHAVAQRQHETLLATLERTADWRTFQALVDREVFAKCPMPRAERLIRFAVATRTRPLAQ
jgi:hypothetical protein